MKRRIKIIVICIAAILAVSLQFNCSSYVLVGYLNTTSDHISKSKVKTEPLDYLTINRDDFTNAYEISVSPKFKAEAKNSFDKNYQMLLAFSSLSAIPQEVPMEVYSPSFVSENINISLIYPDFKENKEIVILQLNELGKDFILSSLASPSGIQGYVRFKNGVTFLRANLIASHTQTAKVFLKEGFFTNSLRIESTVEYPIRFDIHVGKGSHESVKSVTVAPWETQDITISKAATDDLPTVKIEQQLIFNSPFIFKQ